ncbi:hypothetical protein [Dethiobacter alkaliphilus]|uniref:hypothetical protein n=1 Tax=Dethiobacter alkaliphilus TaxID=427926 RepID=UPI0022274C18|nr:hypothetical protein [Dethiobacter alkaliphilus]MCW3490179.1 hypothetical protein [Dethiobacter alkaliphilus]
MGRYYIKKHYRTEEEYPGPEGIHFTRRAAGVAGRFAECDGFLLYEAGQRDGKGPEGAKCVYGYGVVAGEPVEVEPPRVANGKEYPLVVPVEIKKRLADRGQGIPLVILKEEFGIQMRPTLGGVMEISREVFAELQGRIDLLEEEEKK